MLLLFRRQFHPCFVLLAFGAISINSYWCFGQQDTGSEPKSNILRLGDPAGSLKPANPNDSNRPVNSASSTTAPAANRDQPVSIDWNKGDFLPSSSASETDSAVLFIGSSGTRLASVDDSEAPLFAGTTIPLESDVELAIASSMAMKIASATMSHASPFLWLMAGPTTNLVPIETIENEAIDRETIESERIGQETITNEATESNASRRDSQAEIGLSEPPRMKQVAEVPVSIPTLPEKTTLEPNATVDNEIAEIAPRKPAPRTVRIPFEKEAINTKLDAEKSTSRNTAPVPNRDKDSQRDQEEPQLDPKGMVGERDQQGIDALLATKPINNRREVRIDDPSDEGAKVAPIVQAKPLEPVLAKRLQRTEACLAYYLNNPESTSVRSPWAVMHALLAFGGDYEMIHGQGRVNAIGWMCHNGTCRTQRIFTPKATGFTPNIGGGVQGHEGQFLAILAQSNVPLNYPIQVGSAKYTVEDLVRYEMATCKEKSELTFKLIGLSYYLDSNKQWRANDGKTWSISKLIQEELAQPIIGASCGGVHRLMGFSFSVRQRQLQSQPINGQFARAAKFVRDYVEYTWQLQNPDGSFSTSWYEGRANEPNDERKVQTSGHMLEWLMYTLSDAELKDPRAGKAVDFLLTKIYDKRDNKWPIGPRGHATRAVALYQERNKEVLALPSQPSRNPQINSATKTSPAPIRK